MSIIFNIGIISDLLVALGASAGMASVLSALKQYLSRNKDKKIVLGDKEIELSGIKEKDIAIIFEAISELRKHPQVFIAYPSQQKEFARKLSKDLQENGVKIWLDENEIRPGDSIYKKIDNAINESQWVVFIPPSIQQSEGGAEKELKIALESEKVRGRNIIIPIKTSASEPPEFLKDRMWVDFTEDYQQGVQKLLNGIIREKLDTKLDELSE